MIDKALDGFKWFGGLSNSVKVMVVLVVLVAWFGYREYQSNVSEKETLRKTIDYERKKKDDCIEDNKNIVKGVIEFKNKVKTIDSVKTIQDDY